MISLRTQLFNFNSGRWKKALCLKIIGNNEVSTNESLQLDFAQGA